MKNKFLSLEATILGCVQAFIYIYFFFNVLYYSSSKKKFSIAKFKFETIKGLLFSISKNWNLKNYSRVLYTICLIADFGAVSTWSEFNPIKPTTKIISTCLELRTFIGLYSFLFFALPALSAFKEPIFSKRSPCWEWIISWV